MTFPAKEQGLSLVNMGLPSFADSAREQGAELVHLDWKPAAGGHRDLLDILDKIARQGEVHSPLQARIEAANQEAYKRLCAAGSVLVDARPAREVIPDLDEDTILHAGPPITWDRMCGPVRGAIAGALIYEGKAKNYDEAAKLAASGAIRFSPCHHHRTVGPMAGVVSPSMWVWVLRNPVHGNEAYCTLNEGLGKVLRFGAYDAEVMERLRWMEKELAPSLAAALHRSETGINIKAIIAQALQMGDELHNRNVAGTSLLLRELVPLLLEAELSAATIKKVFDFISGNNHFFLNLSMPTAKLAADTILGLADSTVMCAMARNGTDIGIRVAGLGQRWFTAPAGMPKGLYFGGFSEADANHDLGDSTICETAGIGGAAMAAAPAIVKFTGGTAELAMTITRDMGRVSMGPHRDYQIPQLDFEGAPVGVDIRKVVELDSPPYINTGIAHKEPGIGQVGAGLLRAPMSLFYEALRAFGQFEKEK
ncbi:MAG: DUF1116 domain-containing protein [Myxococcota bacterium]|jgi:hypothetical protein|nr:DUF1116 domain-containing protein [Myxococcota bacterium]